MMPKTLFLSYDKYHQKQYFKERRDLIPHNILYEVTDMYNEAIMSYKELTDFHNSEWLEMFLKIDALAFCCDFLKEEANCYKRFRDNKKDNNGIYLETQKKTKEVTLINSAKLHIDKTIELLYELTHNTNNIKILKEMSIVKPPRQQEYFNDINETTYSILSDAKFTTKEITTILPLLKSSYKIKIF
ncbi:MAG TPA: hypothetical protein EYH42_07080 [Sulfurovum sp.]|nr:hypothetical protein [Sulfurovum sp.]